MGVGDFLGSVADTLLPGGGQQSTGSTVGDLINGLGNSIKNSQVGQFVNNLPDVLTSSGDWTTKLLTSAALAGGAYMGARHWAGEGAVERELGLAAEGGVQRAVPIVSPEREALRLPTRYSPETVAGQDVIARFPGVTPRTADVLGAPDYGTMALHLTGTQNPRAAAVIESYAQRLMGEVQDQTQLMGAAQLDWAKVGHAIDTGMITKGRNGDFHKLWGKFQAGTISDGDAGVLQDYVQKIGDATRNLTTPDLSFDPVARVNRMDFLDDGALSVHVTAPVGWTPESAIDQKVRWDRLKGMNLNGQVDNAVGHLKQLYRAGMADTDKYLERSDDWYSNVHQEMLATLPRLQEKFPWLDIERLSAAVSLTSEATDWDQNMQMAESALDVLAKDGRYSSPEMQQWLKDTTGSKTPDESEFQKLLDEAHASVTGKKLQADFEARKKVAEKAYKALPTPRPPFSDYFTEKAPGNFLKADDLRKTLRLFSESGSDVLRETGGQKQKNFFLNLWKPELADGATIDRHQFDIFWGVATGVGQNLNLDLKLNGVPFYNVMEDSVTRAAKELSQELGTELKPHQVQGVVWQTWRNMKFDWNHRSNSWGLGRGPFRLFGEDGSENPIYAALQGLPHDGVKDVYANVPQKVQFVTHALGDGMYTVDGQYGVVGQHTKDMALRVRSGYPGVTNEHGTSFYAASYPQPVADVQAHAALMDDSMTGHHTTVEPAYAWGGQHPVERTAPHAVLEVDDQSTVHPDFASTVENSGVPTVVARPDRSSVSGMTKDAFTDEVNSPLKTRRWAALSAAIDDEQAARFKLGAYDNEARHRQLGEILRRDGYDPIEQHGVYGGAPEPSWLVFDLHPKDAIEYGGMFHQDAVVTNDHMWYTRTAKDPAMAGKAQAFDPEAIRVDTNDQDFVSITPLPGGGEVRWSTAYDPDAPVKRVDPNKTVAPQGVRQTSSVRQVAVPLTNKHLADMDQTLKKLESGGARIVQIHAPGEPPQGFTTVRNHVYTDGVNKMITTTADPELLSPHGYSSWMKVEDARDLPTSNPHGQRFAPQRVKPTTHGGVVNYGGLATADSDVLGRAGTGFMVDTSGSVPHLTKWTGAPGGYLDNVNQFQGPQTNLVRKVGGRFVVDSLNPADVGNEVKIVDLLGRLGVPAEQIQHNIGKDAAEMPFELKGQRKMVNTANGMTVAQARRFGTPVPEWRDRYGVEYYPHARDPQGNLVRVDPAVEPGLKSTFERFMSDPTHADMAKTVGLNRFHLGFESPEGKQSFAWYADMDNSVNAHSTFRRPNASIVLSGHYFTDAQRTADAILEQRAAGLHNPNLPPTPDSILMHELGHMVHNASLMALPTKGARDEFTKALTKAFPKEVWASTSAYAGNSLDEFIAENVAEAIFAEAPRSRALKVYSLLRKNFEDSAAPVRAAWEGWKPA